MTNTPPNLIPVPCGPLTLEFLGHDSPESFDLEAGYPGACLEIASRSIANAYTVLRFDKSFSDWLLTHTGIERGINEKQTEIERARNKAQSKPIYESFPRYLNRIKARVSPELWKEVEAEAIAQSRVFKISVAPSKNNAPLESKFLKRADALLKQELSEINDRVAEMQAIIGNFPLARDPDSKPELESLARLMQQVNNHILSQDD